MIQFFVASNIVVVHANPEYADMDNPRGNIYGERWFIVAENSKGRRWKHYTTFDSANNAERIRSRIEKDYESGIRLKDLYWTEIDPAYGSEEYISQNTELHRLHQERLAG